MFIKHKVKLSTSIISTEAAPHVLLNIIYIIL